MEGKGLALPTKHRAPMQETVGSLQALCSVCRGLSTHITAAVVATHRCSVSPSRLTLHLPFLNSLCMSSEATHHTLWHVGDWTQSLLAHYSWAYTRLHTNFPQSPPRPSLSLLKVYCTISPLIKVHLKLAKFSISDLGGHFMIEEEKNLTKLTPASLYCFVLS